MGCLQRSDGEKDGEERMEEAARKIRKIAG
jgi:hypothetical protein